MAGQQRHGPHPRRTVKRNGVEGPIARFKDTFVTGNNVLTALFCPEDISILPPDERLREERRFSAIRAFWDPACCSLSVVG